MQRINRSLLTGLLGLALSPLLLSWGVFGHEHINHTAVLCLPAPVRDFFYNHIDFITQEATVPDLRKYTLSDKAEYPRHYVDLENFGSRDSFPQTLAEVQKKYDAEFLSKNGTLPWYIDHMMEKLTKAFKEKRKTEILFLAADLGHYIGDAHMPLHTTVNHDGQLTGQQGIHAFWESHLPDLFGKDYNYRCAEARYISDVRTETRKIIFDSHRLVDTLLLAERNLKKTVPAGEVYQLDENGKVMKNKFNQPIHSLAYSTHYHKALNGMVEKQLLKAIEKTSSYWYTAWVNAGKPDLSRLDPVELTARNRAQLKKELDLLRQGKVISLASEEEF